MCNSETRQCQDAADGRHFLEKKCLRRLRRLCDMMTGVDGLMEKPGSAPQKGQTAAVINLEL